MDNHFWQSVDAILEDVPVTETIVWYLTINLKTIIFQCSKNYNMSTRVTIALTLDTTLYNYSANSHISQNDFTLWFDF